MKTFYTERDIEEMHNAGITELAVDDNVVLTDLAREKAIELEIRLLNPADRPAPQPEQMLKALGANLPAPAAPVTQSVSPAAACPPNPPTPANEALIQRIRAAVIARLGTTEHNQLLDQIIPLVLTRLNNTPNLTKTNQSAAAPSDDY